MWWHGVYGRIGELAIGKYQNHTCNAAGVLFIQYLSERHAINACFVEFYADDALGVSSNKDSLYSFAVTLTIILVLLRLYFFRLLWCHSFVLPQPRPLIKYLLRPVLHLR